MARELNHVPSYLRHYSGRGRAVWTDHTGIRRYKLLPGKFGSAESKAALATLVLEQSAAPLRPDESGVSTVAEVLAAYLVHAAKHYKQPDGSLSSEFDKARLSIRRIRELYAGLPAVEFGPLKLKAVRQAWIEAEGRHPQRQGSSTRPINSGTSANPATGPPLTPSLSPTIGEANEVEIPATMT